MENLVGSCYLLMVLPIWMTALIMYMLTQGMLFVLRDYCEGVYYNTSYSAVLGDGALVCIVLMAAGILQRGAPLYEWLGNGYCHFLAISAGMSFGVGWYILDQPKQWGDRYHHLVVASLLTYLGITLVPVIFKNGTDSEWIAVIGLVLIWVVSVVYDSTTKRLDQRNYHNLGGHLDTFKREKMERLGWRFLSH